MNRLFEFAFTDREYRLKTYSISGTVAFICALIARFLLHWDEERVLFLMAGTICSLIAIFILYYVLFGKIVVSEETTSTPATLRRMVLILAVVVAVFFVLATHKGAVPKIQASIVELRLASITTGFVYTDYVRPHELPDDLLKTRFKKLQSVADISYSYKIPVDPNSLTKAREMVQDSLKQSNLSEETRQVGLIAAAKLGGFAALRQTETNTQEIRNMVINSLLEIKNQSLHFMGRHIRISGEGQFSISHSTVVFDGIDFGADRPFGTSFIFADSGSTVVVRDSTITNLDQPLDGVTWINVQFQHSIIRMKDGPFALVNVTFTNCDLRFLDFNSVGADLQQRITRANGQPISFAFDGKAKPPETRQ